MAQNPERAGAPIAWTHSRLCAMPLAALLAGVVFGLGAPEVALQTLTEDAAVNNDRSQPRGHRAACLAGFFCAALACGGAIAQDVYKTIDAQGRAIYSDRPLSEDAKRVNTPQPARNLATGQPSATEAPESPSLAASKKMLADREARIAEAAAAAAEKSAADEAQAALCAKARSEYYEFADGQPRFHLDDAGNRVAYTFAELAAQRQATQQQMEQACAAP